MCAEQPLIWWTRPMLERFKVAHQAAVSMKADTFVFDGYEFVVGYAKYLIEHLNEILHEEHCNVTDQARPKAQSVPGESCCTNACHSGKVMTPIPDDTEDRRRRRLVEINSTVESDDVLTERKRLEARYGQLWDAAQAADDFAVLGFMAPYVVVRRRSDGHKGSLEFQHLPRFYFNFVLD